jgi:signal transduction histidine kinase
MPVIPSTVWHTVIIIQAGLCVSALLYAYLLRRGRFFREHTLAGLAHELKSPLAAIESAVAMLNEADSRAHLSKQKEYLEMIERNSSRLQHYVNNLLHVFKLEETTPPLACDALNLTALCEKLVECYRAAATVKKIRLEFSGPPTDIIVLADAVKIEHVISNLLSNAIKYTDAGAVTVSLKETTEEILVAVADTGRGMLHDEIPYVFDRFFRGMSGLHTKGTGIGLTIARMWVEAHGGQIRAKSDGPGLGSRFCFTLPKR